MSGRLETVRQEASSRRIRSKEEVQVRRIRGEQEVRRERQGRLEIFAEVGPTNRLGNTTTNRLGNTMAPSSSYRSGNGWML